MTEHEEIWLRMRWFGESWNAPMNDESERADVPVGTKCLLCNKPIAETDKGIITACSPSIWGSWDLQTDGWVYRVCSYHLLCWYREVVGGEITGEVLARIQGGTAKKATAEEPVEVTEPPEEDEHVSPGGWGHR